MAVMLNSFFDISGNHSILIWEIDRPKLEILNFSKLTLSISLFANNIQHQVGKIAISKI